MFTADALTKKWEEILSEIGVDKINGIVAYRENTIYGDAEGWKFITKQMKELGYREIPTDKSTIGWPVGWPITFNLNNKVINGFGWHCPQEFMDMLLKKYKIPKCNID